MRKFLADVHMHADFDPERGTWHGERPEKIAERIVHGTELDLCALTEHNKVSDQYFNVRDEIDRQSEIYFHRHGIRRDVWMMLGFELAVLFAERRYHIGFVFDEEFFRGSLPDVSATRINVEELEDYRVDFPGVVILNHPTWKDSTPREREITREFMGSGYVEGVEILNGSAVMYQNGRSKVTGETANLFVDVRRRQEAAKRAAHHRDQPVRQPIAPIGSSDAHKAAIIGSAATEYYGNSKTDFFDAVRRGTTRVVPIEQNVVLPHLIEVQRSIQYLSKYLSIPKFAHKDDRARRHKRRRHHFDRGSDEAEGS